MEKALFKAKGFQPDQWHKGYLTTDAYGKKMYIESIKGKTLYTNQVRSETILKYIGEINGVKVWEGDIHLTETECDGQTVKGYLPIVYDNGAYWLDVSRKKDGSHLELLAEIDETLNIVGNIIDNPELLKIT